MSHDPLNELADKMEKMEQFEELSHVCRSVHHPRGLDEMIRYFFVSNKIDHSRRTELKYVKTLLHNAIYRKIGREFCLNAFGSSLNGFGTNASDLDVCFRFKYEYGNERTSQKQMQTICYIEIALREAGIDVISIRTARVPIVKFAIQTHRGLIEGDISYYNELALYTTRMFRRYCSWTKDDLLSKLGLFIKRWAKACDICEAPRGSLSSHAWIILLIHFLQRVKPHPLLPVLQEMGDKQIIDVDGCNAYFCDDEPKSDWSQCTLSEGELFLQFFVYYSNFNWEKEVVQIHQLNTQVRVYRKAEYDEDKFEWEDEVIISHMHISDPFDLNNNVGFHIRLRMFEFIKKAFTTSLKIFSEDNENAGTMNQFDDAVDERFADRHGDALLAKCKSSIGTAPRDGQCRRCGIVGHIPRNCPYAHILAATTR